MSFVGARGAAPAPRAGGIGRGLVLSVALGTVLNPVNSSMLAVALVPIAHYFRTSVVAASWLVSALYITTAVAQPTWGRICDAGMPRRVFLTGGCLVALAGALAPFAPGIPFLVGVRVLLGLGTASAYPSALAIVRRAADRAGGEVPNAALGGISFAAQVTNAFGPALGGLLVTIGGWKWVFLFNLPFVAVTIALAYHYVPRDEPRTPVAAGAGPRLRVRDLDPVGIALFAGATGLGVGTLLNVQAAAPLVVGLAVGAVTCAVLFVGWERRTRTPFIPLSLFAANSKLGRTYARVALFNTVFYAIYYGWPIWLERGRGLSPSTTGLVTLPIAAVGAIAAMAGTRLSRGRGPRRVLIIGSAVLLAGGLALLGVTSATPIPLLIAVAVVLGIPNGFNSVGNQLATYQQAPASLAGVAAGLQRTSSYIGANIASALVGLTVSASGSRGTSGSLHVMAGVLAAISTSLLLGAILNRSLSERSVAADDAPASTEPGSRQLVGAIVESDS
jgi:MFS family permease